MENVWTPEPKGHGYTDKVRATALSVIAGTGSPPVPVLSPTAACWLSISCW